MSRLTDLIENKYEEHKYKSMRQYLKSLGITQQKFYNWKEGAVPDDKTLINISEKLGIEFLKLVALAKSNDKKGTAETRAEWRKIATQIERQRQIGLRRRKPFNRNYRITQEKTKDEKPKRRININHSLD